MTFHLRGFTYRYRRSAAGPGQRDVAVAHRHGHCRAWDVGIRQDDLAERARFAGGSRRPVGRSGVLPRWRRAGRTPLRWSLRGEPRSLPPGEFRVRLAVFVPAAQFHLRPQDPVAPVAATPAGAERQRTLDRVLQVMQRTTRGWSITYGSGLPTCPADSGSDGRAAGRDPRSARGLCRRTFRQPGFPQYTRDGRTPTVVARRPTPPRLTAAPRGDFRFAPRPDGVGDGLPRVTRAASPRARRPPARRQPARLATWRPGDVTSRR